MRSARTKRVIREQYGNDRFLYSLDHDIKAAWHMIAQWYMDDLFDMLEDREIKLVLTMSPDDAIVHLGNMFYKGYSRIHTPGVRKNVQDFPDFDTESTSDQIKVWREEVWSEVITCMIEITHSLTEYLREDYDTPLANDFLSLCGSYDIQTIYGFVLKNTEDPDDSSTSTNEDPSDTEYDSEGYY